MVKYHTKKVSSVPQVHGNHHAAADSTQERSKSFVRTSFADMCCMKLASIILQQVVM